MRKNILVAASLLFGLFAAAQVGAQDLPLNIQPKLYGFMAFDAIRPNGKDESIAWARLGVLAQITAQTRAQYEYDLSTNQVKFAYIEALHPVGDGVVLKGRVGQFLPPVPQLYPGPASIAVPRFAHTLDDYTLFMKGVDVEADRGHWVLNIAQGRGLRNKALDAALTYRIASAMWEQKVGPGVLLDGTTITHGRWFNPAAGWSRKDSASVNRYFVQDFVRLPVPGHDVRLYLEQDRQANATSAKDSFMGGLTWVYAYRSYMELFYDSDVKGVIARATFEFFPH